MSPLVANVIMCLLIVVTILLQSTRTDAVGKEASVNKAHAPGSSWKGKESCTNNGDMFHLNDKNSVHLRHDKVSCNVTELDNVSKQQCGDKCFAIKCRGGLTSISHIRGPDMHLNDSLHFCKLDLKNNLIKRLRGREFITANVTQIKVLCLSSNCISIIDSTAFDGLTQLMYLNLSMNMLTWPTSFGQGVFAPLGNLITLNLKANNFTTYDRLDTEMVHLKNLTNLFIDAHNGFGFNERFKQLTNLTQLSISGNMEQDSNIPHCNVTFVPNDTFVNIPNLKWLYMSYCHITSIDKEAFSPLSQLEVLDISYNENLHFKGMNDAMYGLRNSTTLKELNVNQINSLYEEGIKVKAKHLENLVNITSLLRVHMDLNKIEVFDKIIFDNNLIPSSVQYLTLCGNRLTYGEYAKHLHRVKTDIVSVDISRQHLKIDPFKHQHYHRSDMNEYLSDAIRGTHETLPCSCKPYLPNKCTRFVFPQSLKKIIWSQSFVYGTVPPTIICLADSLRYINVAFNVFHSWQGPVYNVENITYLDLSENNCKNMSASFFYTFSGLKNLNVSGNFLGPLFSNRDKYKDAFAFMPKLRSLDLAYNRISKLPNQIFSKLQKLKNLDLSGNMMDQWNASLKNIHCLSKLDLSSNKLDSLSVSLMNDLDSMTGDQCLKGKSANVSVILKHNPIECSCRTLPFLKWAHVSNVVVEFSVSDRCRLKDGTWYFFLDSYSRHQTPLIIRELERTCVDYNWLVTMCSVVLTGIISVILCGFMYRHRWKIRYMYHSRNRRHTHVGYERIFEFDAFISYTSDDGNFIKQNLVPELEDRHGLKLWVADRNSTPGASVAQNLTHAIYNSRKTILLATRTYFDDNWCDYEMHMAHVESVETKRKLMIIVLMEDIPDALPISVLRLLQSEKSMEYPHHPQHVTTFWTDLANTIMTDQ